MKEEKTKITLKHFNVEIEAQLPWDADLELMYNVFRGLLVTVGYSAQGIDNHIKEMAEEINIE